METIRDLLPNEHFLDFSGDVVLPEWFGTEDKTLIMGAGDLRHNAELNVQMFHMFDVYFCKPWDWDGSLRQNMEYLLANYLHQKILCFIDVYDRVQMAKFTNLFKNRFRLIDGHLGHCPHLNFTDLQKVLIEGGKAVNVFECSDTCISLEKFKTWLNYDFLDSSSAVMLTGHIYTNGSACMSLPEDDTKQLVTDILAKIHSLLANQKTVTISTEIMDTLPSLRVRQLQPILYSVFMASQMPITLVGTFQSHKRCWLSNSIDELVIVKRSIDYKVDEIAEYTLLSGVDSIIAFINKVKAGILNDLEKGDIFGGKAKFKTLQKYVDTHISLPPKSLSA
jgi:hypothetical protein